MNTIKKIIQSKQVRNRILFTILVLFVFHVGSLITLPGVSAVAYGKQTFTNFLNITTGGTLQSFGFLALGVSPYITSSILIQLMSKGVSPYYTELSQQGQLGQQKIQQHIRYFSILFGMISALSIMFSPQFTSLLGVTIEGSVGDKFIYAIVLTVGSLFTLWLGEKIDEYGVGQGSSVLIAYGILKGIPEQIINVYNQYPFFEVIGRQSQYFWGVAGLVVAYALVIFLSIKANKKEYHIPIQSKSNPTVIKAHYYPIKLLASSVMPVIFATSIMSLLGLGTSFFTSNTSWTEYNTPIGFVIYIGLIFVFSYIYNTIQISGEEIEKGLNESSMYITGISNNDVSSFITKKVINITHKGAPTLALIAGIAIGVELVIPGDMGLSLTGVSVLILIGVLQELTYQINGLIEKNKYKELI